jgi:hypothetical protein
MPTVAAAGVGALLALGGCSLLNSSGNAAATSPATSAGAHPSAAGSSSALPSDVVEAASALPRSCSAMLTTAQLQSVFGPGVPIGTDYGSYAALPSIGRTGRVVCVFGVGLDSFGRQSSGMVEVALATYGSAADAAGRAANTVQQDSAAGATTAQVSVGGHPATLVVEPQAVGASSAPPAAPAASASAAASAPPPASASPGATAGTGETQLVMADGNRTFVFQIPFSALDSAKAATALTQLALYVYQNTLPGTGAGTTQSSSTG